MRHVVLVATVAIAIGTALACSSSGSATDDAPPGDPGGVDEAGAAKLPPSSSSSTGPAGTGLATGLPCDVQAVLEDRCIACHSGASPPPLLSYADLIAKSKTDPTKSMAQVSLARMNSKTSPMPPLPAEAPLPDEIKTFADWVAAGTPKGALCTDTPPDGGAPKPGDGGASGASKCTSGTTWKDGNTGSALMHPGVACKA